jgi:hypothetical protein
MKKHSQYSNLLVLSASILLVPRIGFSQGTFQNLNFESANVPFVPQGQPGGFVSVSDGLPGWTAYLPGVTTVNQIGHNSVSIGGAAIDIEGPQWDSSQILQGNYTVLLQSGLNSGNGQPSLTAAIGQTGLIPSTAQSVGFFEGFGGNLHVTFNGQPIPVVPLGAGTNFVVYGGDISAFAGQTGELRFTSPESPLNGQGGALLDNIFFSIQPIPEPSALGLFAVGLFIFSWRSLSKRP